MPRSLDSTAIASRSCVWHPHTNDQTATNVAAWIFIIAFSRECIGIGGRDGPPRFRTCSVRFFQQPGKTEVEATSDRRDHARELVGRKFHTRVEQLAGSLHDGLARGRDPATGGGGGGPGEVCKRVQG